MPQNQIIKADVYDLQPHVPAEGDRYLIDSNVWLWLAYLPASMNAFPYQVEIYPGFIKRARSKKAELFWCGLSFAELAHLIEKEEHERYQLAHSTTIGLKELRHTQNHRTRVTDEISAAWKQISSMASQTSIHVNNTAVGQALNDICTMPLDGYDLFFHQVLVKHGLTKVVTDDSDYASVPGIEVYTANNAVIRQAREQGKLREPALTKT